MTTEPLFKSDGTEYTGEVFINDKDQPFCEVSHECSACGGSGVWKRRRVRRDCLRCEGNGTIFDQERLYTEKQFNQRESRKKKRQEKAIQDEIIKLQKIEENYEVFYLENKTLIDYAQKLPNPFIQDLLEKAKEWGGLTEKQHEAFVAAVSNAKKGEALYGESQPVGIPGERMELILEAVSQKSKMVKKFRRRGMQELFITELKDEDGNAFLTVTPNFTVSPGEKVRVKATIKGHETERQTWPVTLLSRVAVLENINNIEYEKQNE